MPRRFSSSYADFTAQFDALLNTKRESEEDVAQAVRTIIDDVRARGDAALIDLTARFDRVTVTADTLRLPESEIAAAEAKCPKSALAALDVAARRIETYHRKQLPEDARFIDDTG